MRVFQCATVLGLSIWVSACAPPGASAGLPRATESAPPAFGELLARYATPSGVRYAAWHQNATDLEKLKSVVDFFAGTLPPKEREASLAWHLNAYNAGILQGILQKYPTKGPLDGDPSFFQKTGLTISGKPTSFDAFEQKVIRPTFGDPRVHFALNCASQSCPPLHTKPFTSATLDADLDRLATTFINENPQGVVLQGRDVKLSKIFEWYAGDFGGKDRVLDFINRYRREPIPENTKIQFLEYGWNLNAVE